MGVDAYWKAEGETVATWAAEFWDEAVVAVLKEESKFWAEDLRRMDGRTGSEEMGGGRDMVGSKDAISSSFPLFVV